MSEFKTINIVSHFVEIANKHPNVVAIIDDGHTLSFGELYTKVTTRAAYFKTCGIKKGDRVLVLIPMSLNLYEHILALFYIGAVPVFIDEWVNLKRLRMCCQIADCKAVLASGMLYYLSLIIPEIRIIPIKIKSNRLVNSSSCELQICSEEDPALITFTTGSTGLPKAAIRTHGILNEQFSALRHKTALSLGEVSMTSLPIVLLINLGAGATTIMAKFKPKKPQQLDVRLLAGQIQQYKVKTLMASPYFLLRLSEADESKLATVEKVFTGGAPVFPTDAAHLVNGFKNATVEIVYGSTEAEPISSILANELISDKAQLEPFGLNVGSTDTCAKVKIIPYVNIRWPVLTNNEWEKLSSSMNWGEIVVAGKHVVKHYLNNEGAFKENKIVVEDTIWHRTGDAGRLIENDIFLLGRCKYMIEKEGNSYSPFIYEALLKQITGIASASCVYINEEIVLVIELKKNVNKLVIEKEINKSSIVYDRLVYMDSIPKDQRHFSKVDYEALIKKIK